MVQSVRYVKEALLSSGPGWMDAELEVAVIRPHIYASTKAATCRKSAPSANSMPLDTWC